jgi:hypothetical protein
MKLPDWAMLQHRLIRSMNEAGEFFVRRYPRRSILIHTVAGGDSNRLPFLAKKAAWCASSHSLISRQSTGRHFIQVSQGFPGRKLHEFMEFDLADHDRPIETET